MARGGIEPPTRGFSVQISYPHKALIKIEFYISICGIFSEIHRVKPLIYRVSAC
jgi:hypothetical protein